MRTQDLKRSLTRLRNNLDELQDQLESSNDQNYNDSTEEVISIEELEMVDDPQTKRLRVSSPIDSITSNTDSDIDGTLPINDNDALHLPFVPLYDNSSISLHEIATGMFYILFLNL
jgi:hypothetical protein